MASQDYPGVSLPSSPCHWESAVASSGAAVGDYSADSYSWASTLLPADPDESHFLTSAFGPPLPGLTVVAATERV